MTSTLPCPGYSIWNAWNGGWIPWNGDGLHGMRDGFHAFLRWNGGWTPYFFHGMGDGFHIFFTFLINPDLDPYGMSSFKINYYNIFDRNTYINLFKYAREGGESVVQSDEGRGK